MAQFFSKVNENAVSSSNKAEIVSNLISRIGDLAQKTEKLAFLNKNQDVVSGFEWLTKCRATIMAVAKTPSTAPNPFESTAPEPEVQTARFGQSR